MVNRQNWLITHLYYLFTKILQFFKQFVVTPTRCSINTRDLKIFPNTNMLLKVEHFEGFSNRSNVDELVITNISGCNCSSYKLNNNLARKKCSLTVYSEYFLI